MSDQRTPAQIAAEKTWQAAQRDIARHDAEFEQRQREQQQGGQQ